MRMWFALMIVSYGRCSLIRSVYINVAAEYCCALSSEESCHCCAITPAIANGSDACYEEDFVREVEHWCCANVSFRSLLRCSWNG